MLLPRERDPATLTEKLRITNLLSIPFFKFQNSLHFVSDKNETKKAETLLSQIRLRLFFCGGCVKLKNGR